MDERATALEARDRSHLIRHSALKGAQTLALASPPAYLAAALYRRSFSLNNALKAIAISTVRPSARERLPNRDPRFTRHRSLTPPSFP